MIDGAPDETFGPRGVVDSLPNGEGRGRALAQDAQGRLYVLARSSSGCRLKRHLPSGKDDPSFGNSAGFIDFTDSGLALAECSGVAVQPDGKVVIAGSLVSTKTAFVARVTDKGERDATFGPQGLQLIDNDSGLEFTSVAIGPDDKKIYVGGTVGAMGLVRRFDGTTGAYDLPYAPSAGMTRVTWIGFDNAKKLVAMGTLNDGFALARLDPSGAGNSAVVSPETDRRLTSRNGALAPDGRAVLVGAADWKIGGQTDLGDGAVTTFDAAGPTPPFLTARRPTGGTLRDEFVAAAFDTKGRVILAGGTIENGQAPRPFFHRHVLAGNGDLDPTFGSGGVARIEEPAGEFKASGTMQAMLLTGDEELTALVDSNSSRLIRLWR